MKSNSRMKPKIGWSTFFKISLVIMISILLSNLVTMFSSTYITKNLFIQSSTFLNSKLMNNILQKVEEGHSKRQSLIRTLETRPALKNYYMAVQPDSAGRMTMTYDILKVLHDFSPAETTPNIVTISNSGKVFTYSGGSLSDTPERILDLSISKAASKTSRQLHYYYQDSGITNDFKNQDCIIAVRKMFLPSSSQDFATAYITIPEEEFYRMFSDAVPEESEMFILSSEGRIVSGSDKNALGAYNASLLAVAQSLSKTGRMFETIKYKGASNIVIAEYIDALDMYMVNVVEEHTLLKSYMNIRRNIMMSGLAITGAAVILVFFMMQKIVSPLTFFVRQLETFKNKKFEKVNVSGGNSEVRQMGEVYNQMVDEIDSYVGRLMKEQERCRRLEIEALQMQINPHFMYNTLASIKYLAWQNDAEKVSDTINALITILRKTIGDMDEEITMQEELSITRQYVYINQIRYGDAISVEYFISEACMDCLVPKLILQPFIENAFFHAFQEKKEGNIRVFIRIQKEDVVCEIIDEGDGMTEDELAHMMSEDHHRHFTGIGIPNVYERIRFMYGEAYGITLHSVSKTGTSVTIRLPYHIKKYKKHELLP